MTYKLESYSNIKQIHFIPATIVVEYWFDEEADLTNSKTYFQNGPVAPFEGAKVGPDGFELDDSWQQESGVGGEHIFTVKF